ncbi:MAG: hypothetical protein JSV85_07105 [Candidatus Bathyarchaeota archaeon]|nr:MAG: hypothetical protein JSV85_07105 [Candidatus Bathyarchaeota archaeon]
MVKREKNGSDTRLKFEHFVVVFSGIVIVSFLIGMALNVSPISPQGFGGTPAYDSGWLDITDKTGQDFNITHNLGSTDIVVDITGKRAANDEAHQRNLGGTDYTSEEGRQYGGLQFDLAYSVVQTVDGGYALAGYTTSPPPAFDRDLWLVKIDANGNMQWNREYGGAGHDNAHSLVQTSDGGYAIAGLTRSYGAGDWDFWLVKTDSAGNVEWNQTYGGAGVDGAWSIVETGDGGYAIVGYTESYGAGNADFWLVKTDSAGNVEWNQTYGGTGVDEAYSLVATSDGGYALVGQIGGNSSLVKVDSSGNQEFNSTYGGANEEYAASVIETSDGGYAIAGSIEFWGPDFWLVKTDSVGNEQWARRYGGEGTEVAHSVVQADDGGYVLAGYTNSIGAGQYDFWLVKFDSVGSVVWSETFGTAAYEEARSLIKTSDGGYAIGGYIYPSAGGDLFFVKTDESGNVFPYRFKYGLAWTNTSADAITLYRGTTDPYWNYVRVRIWETK